MKGKKMKFYRTMLPLVAVVALLVSSAHAQDSERAQIDFPGGTIEQYAQLLKEVKFVGFDEQAIVPNIVVTSSARDYRLPSININASYDGAMGVMSACSTKNSRVVVDSDDTGQVYIVRVETDEEVDVSVVSAQQLLENVDQATLLSAVEIGLEMHDAGASVTLRLHEESGLMFLKGPVSGIQLVESIIERLEDNANYLAHRKAQKAAGSSSDK